MRTCGSQELLDRLIRENQDLVVRTKMYIQPLGEHVLSYSNHPHRWNICQCYEHLNLVNQHYFQNIEHRIGATFSHRVTPGEAFRPGLLANRFIAYIAPQDGGNIRKSFKTLSAFDPRRAAPATRSIRPQEVIQEFLHNQSRLIHLLEQAQNLDLNQCKVTSSLGNVLRFKLGDAFRFVTAHNHRHFIQAQDMLREVRP